MSARLAAIEASFEDLLAALHLVDRGDGRFVVPTEPGRFTRVFGGQLLAQALLAAQRTVPDKTAQSLHAYFVDAGRSEIDVAITASPMRDGRSLATRHVDVHQGERLLLGALAAFHDVPSGPQVAAAPRPAVRAPDDMPTLQDWAARAPEALGETARIWIDAPPPLDVRMDEPLAFLGGSPAAGPRTHWMRVPRPVGDRALDAALLAYASDYFLMDMAFRSRPDGFTTALTGLSVDHAIWFHAPVHFDRWHLHTQETIALGGERGLVRGAIHDLDGRLVASVVQEVLIRTRRPTRP